MTNPIQTYQGVYCVEQQDALGVTQDWSIAVRLQIDKEKQRVLWSDGARGRVVDYENIADLEIEYTAEQANGIQKEAIARKISVMDSFNHFSYALIPLTLEVYNDRIKPRISGHPEFENEQLMTEFFLKLV